MFYFVESRPDADAWEPALPDHVSYIVLAVSNDGKPYALVECEPLDPDDLLPTIQPVEDDLENLLWSARQYGPAIALTCE